MKVDEYNGTSEGMANGWYQKFWRFPSNAFWEKHWLSCFRSYLWCWGFEAVVEGRGIKINRKNSKRC